MKFLLNHDLLILKKHKISILLPLILAFVLFIFIEKIRPGLYIFFPFYLVFYGFGQVGREEDKSNHMLLLFTSDISRLEQLRIRLMCSYLVSFFVVLICGGLLYVDNSNYFLSACISIWFLTHCSFSGYTCGYYMSWGQSSMGLFTRFAMLCNIIFFLVVSSNIVIEILYDFLNTLEIVLSKNYFLGVMSILILSPLISIFYYYLAKHETKQIEF